MSKKVFYLSILTIPLTVILTYLEVHVLFILAAVFIFLFIILTTSALLYEYEKSKLNKEERKESLLEGGIEEPQSFRPLSIEEKEILLSLYQTARKIANNGWWLIILFAVIDLSGIFVVLRVDLDSNLSEVVGLLYSIAFIIQFAFAGVVAKETPRYLDLRSLFLGFRASSERNRRLHQYNLI